MFNKLIDKDFDRLQRKSNNKRHEFHDNDAWTKIALWPGKISQREMFYPGIF